MAEPTQETVVEVETRSTTGKNAARRLRADGRLPANVYGMKLPAVAVVVERRRIRDVLHLASGQNTILKLSMAGGSETRDVMIKELQRDPVTDRLTHVDFIRIDPKREVHVDVAVQLLGLPEGVKNEAGILDFVHRAVEVACLPTAIPEHFEIDISGLHLNQHVSVGDLQPPEGVRLLDDPQTILAVVVPSKVEVAAVEEAEAEEAAAEEGAAAAEGEPEVIKKGKEAGEGPSAERREK